MGLLGKMSNKVGIEGIYYKTVKAKYDKPMASIILNSEKLKAVFLRSGRRQDALSPLLFNVVLEVLRIRQEIKRIQIRKEEV